MTELNEENVTSKQRINELKKKLGDERKRLEFIEQIIHSVPAIIYLFDISELEMIWCNQRHQEFVGFDVTGMKLQNEEGEFMKIFKNDQNLARSNITKWRNSAQKPGKVIIRLTDSDGQQQYFYTNHHIYKTDDNGDPLWMLGIGININQKEHSEHEKRILYSQDIGMTYQLMEKLSDQELQILDLLSDGNSYQEIAQKINLSVDGVRYHIRKIYQTLEVNSRAEAIKIAMKYRLIQL